MIVREWLKKLLDPTEREVKRLWPVVHKINALEPEIQKLTAACENRRIQEAPSGRRNAGRYFA
jgi:preprotein translocase subunit SecA